MCCLKAQDIAKWASDRLSKFTNADGDHFVEAVSDVKTQVLDNTIQFDFMADVAIKDKASEKTIVSY